MPGSNEREIQCSDRRQPPGPISFADEVLKLIHGRPGEPRAELDDRREIELPGKPDRATEEKPMADVGPNQAVFVRTDDRISEVAVELVVIVQIRRPLGEDI